MKEVVFKLKADGSQVNKSLKEIKEEIDSLNQALEKESIGTKRFKELAGALQDAQSEVKGLEKQFEGLEPEKKVEAFAKLGEGIAGGFAAATGAMALFGSENQKIEELMVKTQAAVAIAMGARAVSEGIVQGQIAKRLILDKLATVQTGLLTAATTAYNIVVGTTTGALKLLRVAMVSTGIGALVVGVGLLIANFDKVMDVVKNLTAQFLEFATPVRQFLEYLNIIDTEEEKLSANQLERSKTRVENWTEEEAIRQRAIDLAKAQGKSEKEIAALEIKLLEDKKNAYREYIRDKIKNGQAVTNEEVTQLNEIANVLAIRQATLETAARKEAEEERKRAEERRKAREKEYSDYIKQINEQLVNAKIEAISDGQKKEIALENKALEDKLKAIKGNSEVELALREQLEENSKNRLEAIKTKYAEEASQKALTDATNRIQKEYENEIAQQELVLLNKNATDEERYQAEQELVKIRRDQELQNQSLSLAQQRVIIEEAEQRITEIKNNALQERVNNEVAKSEALLSLNQSTQSSLQSLTELGIVNGKKASAASKALALAQIAIETAKSIAQMVGIATNTGSASGPAGPAVYAATLAGGIASILANVASASKLLGKSSVGDAASVATNISNGVQPQSPQSTDNTPRVKINSAFNIKATVVETDVTDTQSKVRSIEETATI